MEDRTAIIHLLCPDTNGPIIGREGRRFSVACAPDSICPKHATGQANAATCELCRETEIYEEILTNQRFGGNIADREVYRAREAKRKERERARAEAAKQAKLEAAQQQSTQPEAAQPKSESTPTPAEIFAEDEVA